MKASEFKDIYYRLRRESDVKKLAKETGYSEELLFVIYTQRTVRDATRRYYPIKHTSPKLLKQWRKGKSFFDIANEIDFPPVLTALMLLQEDGISRKRFWKIAREQERYPNPRLEKEIKQIMANDPIYSEEGMKVQTDRGIEGEERLQEWLEKQGLGFRPEEELRGEFKKTPDCLLDEPMIIDGREVYWFESKASFGDKVEIRKNNRRQLVPYTEIFGPGIVVYWFGFVDDVETPDDIWIVDDSFFFGKAPPMKPLKE